MATQEKPTSIPGFREFDIELRRRAEAAAERSGYSVDLVDRAVFGLGWIDGYNGADIDQHIPGGYERPYEAGHSVGIDARAHDDMLSNSIPAKMTLGAVEDIDLIGEPSCPMCGAVLKVDGSCDFCPPKCSNCDTPLDNHGFCPNENHEGECRRSAGAQ